MLIVPPVNTTATRGIASVAVGGVGGRRRRRAAADGGGAVAGRSVGSPASRRVDGGRRLAARPRSGRRRARSAGPRMRPHGPASRASGRAGTRSRRRRRAPRWPTTSMTAAVPTRSEIGPDDDDRQEARHRDEHVQDAEDAAADLLRQVLLELRLRRDGDGAVGDARDERDDHDDREQRGRPPTGRAGRSPRRRAAGTG